MKTLSYLDAIAARTARRKPYQEIPRGDGSSSGLQGMRRKPCRLEKTGGEQLCTA